MSDIEKWCLGVIGVVFTAPLIGLGISQWHERECRVELAKIGKTVDEIKELCK